MTDLYSSATSTLVMRGALGGALLAALLLGACSKSPPEAVTALRSAPSVPVNSLKPDGLLLDGDKVLNLALLPDYLPQSLIPDFERETGISVRVDHFESYETLNTKLVAGNTGYDLVVAASGFAKPQIAAGFFQPLQTALVRNLGHVDPAILHSLQTVDPGSRHLLPWAWGYTGVGVNRPLVQKALGDLPWPDNAWQLIFDPVYTRRLAKCGLAYLDAPTEIVPAAALYLGFNPYQLKPEDLKAIDAMLGRVRKDVRVLSTLLIDEFATGKACAALVWAGDMHSAQLRAKELDPKADLQALVPKNGGLLFVDALAIPADAKRVKNAHAFIDFYLRADNAAKQTNEMGYLSGNLAATPLIDTAITGNPAVFLPPEQLARMTAPDSFGNAARAAMAESYTRFKASR